MQHEKNLSLREEPEIVATIDKIAFANGIDRSGFIRIAIREKIERDSKK